MKSNRKKITGIIKIIIIIYCLIGIALYYLQDRFLFHPQKLEQSYIYHFNQPFEELTIPVNKTEVISMVKFFPADSIVKGVVVYFHGNRNNINQYADNAERFTRAGYEVWMGDYPGFGKTTGELTEKRLYEQATTIYRLALSKFKSDSIIIYGKSLGTGIAAYVAANNNSRILLLETPYHSIHSLFSSYAFIYPMSVMANFYIPTFKYLEDVKEPVIIFHGTGDDVIPYANAKMLIPYLKEGDKFITVKAGGHNTLGSSTLFNAVIDSVLN